MKYSPPVISGLFLDNNDSDGLLFWYDFIIDLQKSKK